MVVQTYQPINPQLTEFDKNCAAPEYAETPTVSNMKLVVTKDIGSVSGLSKSQPIQQRTNYSDEMSTHKL